jgi:RNA polymerase sigma factor (sigma-70 family)
MMDAKERFRCLFDEAYPALRRYALHRGLTGADADDLVAATLEVAWRRLSDVPRAEPLPWLYCVARNLLRNQRRGDRRRDELVNRLANVRRIPASTDPLEMGTGLLQQALAQLSGRDQELLKLVAWDGLSPSQAAVVLGCSPAAARTRLNRARGRLAVRLGADPRIGSPGRAGKARADQSRSLVSQGLEVAEVSDG